jgi:chemotaxis protein histidine kinase CheA/ActR/RegA family two-component response regulator
MSNNFDKFAILESFLDEVSSYLPEIQPNLDRLQQEPSNSDVIEETYRRAHTIAGSAAMMEYSALAHVAQGMEDSLGDALDAQSPIDQPAIGLLRRSFTRLSRLIEHIRSGEDDAPIVAEDDADRAALRGSAAVPSTSGAHPADFAATFNGAPYDMQDAGTPNGRDASASSPLHVPDWLAAFAGPAGGAAAENPTAPQQGPDLGAPNSAGSAASDYWTGPVEPAQPPNGYASQSFPAYQPAPSDRGVSSDGSHDPYYGGGQGLGSAFQASTASPEHAPDESFEDILRSFQAGSAQPHGEPGISGYAPPPTGPLPGAPSPYAASDLGTSALPTMPPTAQPSPFAPSPVRSTSSSAGSLVPALSELRADEEAVRRQVATLRDITAHLRDAAQAMEDERIELRSFLDGSRDALERLENWAGQQMGLDLRHSPDSVRRYLPLSVIWVTTTRLKQLVTLLKSSDRGLTTTQEQIEETLNELRSAIESTGHIYSTMSTIAGPPDTGFSATVAQFSWAPPPVPAAQSSVDALSPATRAELERTVRDQLRRELEDEVRAEVAADVRHDEEDRLRQELQIQVRRQLLSELSPSLGASSLPVPSAGDVLPSMLLSSERAPKPVQVTSDQSPEAQEVFREEAQEHLQTITTGIAQLETTPGDISVLQSIRRAMHTLKGAAGMMGFTTIQQLAHASEDLLDRFVDEGASLTPNVMSLLLDTSEALDQLVGNLSVSPAEQQQMLRSLTERYAEVLGPSDSEAVLAAGNVAPVAVEEPEEPVDARTAGETTPDLSVRLQLSKLDDLVNLFGELLINRSILEERIDRLNRLVTDTVVVGERLREVGGQLETRFEAATLPSGRGSLPLPGSSQTRDPAASWAPATPRAISGGLQQAPQFAHEFDELELDRYTEFHRLSRGLSEGVADAVTLSHEMETLIRECQTSFTRENRLTSDFQDRLLKARLVPLQSLVPRLYRTARASALREGKDIEFYAEGMDTEVDRKVFEELAGPLLHIVRNAVNHAIERPNVREMEGKARAGRILVAAAYEGNQVVISVRDDGAGINPDKIRETAIARGWIDPYTNLTEKEALNLIFQPGVSTAETVTEESGRGVGLDVVRDTVSRLRGTVEVESSIGQGTVFTMKFPISLQIARAVLVRVGSQTLALPMAVVDQIGRLDYYQKIPGATPAIELRGEQYPLAHLASYLKLQQGPIDERSSVLLVNAGKRRVALLVDSIVAQQEIVSKPLGPHLREVQGVAGAAVLGNGQVILILEMHELLAQQPRGAVVLPPPTAATPPPPPAAPPAAPPARSATTVTQQPTAPMPAFSGAASVQSVTAPTAATPAPSMPSVNQTPATARRDFVVAQRPPTGTLPNRTVVPPAAQNTYVLVVDDSPSVRRVVSNMLKAHGWEVQTARDGVEALEVIARQMPAAVLLDIEMPRMDGYELMATVRSQEQYRFLPLIVLTSRAATKHQQRALQLGADAYVVKPYQDEELLNTIATLVQARR